MTATLDAQSIADLVQMSVGTEKGSWFAGPAFGSELRTTEKVDNNTAFVVQRMIVQATRWLLNDGLAADIAVEARRSGESGGKSRIDAIEQPDFRAGAKGQGYRRGRRCGCRNRRSVSGKSHRV